MQSAINILLLRSKERETTESEAVRAKPLFLCSRRSRDQQRRQVLRRIRKDKFPPPRYYAALTIRASQRLLVVA
jgi:hypothetical protein